MIFRAQIPCNEDGFHLYQIASSTDNYGFSYIDALRENNHVLSPSVIALFPAKWRWTPHGLPSAPPKGDICGLAPAGEFFSPRALDLMESIHPGTKTHAIEVMINGVDRYFYVQIASLDKVPASGAHFFVPTRSLAGLCATGEMKQIIEDAGLTGIEFIRIPNDEPERF